MNGLSGRNSSNFLSRALLNDTAEPASQHGTLPVTGRCLPLSAWTGTWPKDQPSALSTSLTTCRGSKKQVEPQSRPNAPGDIRVGAGGIAANAGRTHEGAAVVERQTAAKCDCAADRMRHMRRSPPTIVWTWFHYMKINKSQREINHACSVIFTKKTFRQHGEIGVRSQTA